MGSNQKVTIHKILIFSSKNLLNVVKNKYAFYSFYSFDKTQILFVSFVIR